MEYSTAVHETGHGLMALHCGLQVHTISGYGCTQVLSTVEPWGYALGQAYAADSPGTRRELTAQCATLLAGCVVGGQPFWGSHDARQLEQFAAAWDDVVRNHRPQVLPQWSVIMQDAERTVQQWWAMPGTPALVEAVALELSAVDQLTGAQWAALVARWQRRLGSPVKPADHAQHGQRPSIPRPRRQRTPLSLTASDFPALCSSPPCLPAGFHLPIPRKKGSLYA